MGLDLQNCLQAAYTNYLRCLQGFPPKTSNCSALLEPDAAILDSRSGYESIDGATYG